MMRNLIVVAASLALFTACGQSSTEDTSAEAAPAAAETSAPEPAALIPRETIFGNAERTIARISPDGAHVSWLAENDGVMNIWVAAADDTENRIPIGQRVV